MPVLILASFFLNQAVISSQYYGGQYGPLRLATKQLYDDFGRKDTSVLDPRLCGSYIALLERPGKYNINFRTACGLFTALAQMPKVHPYLLTLAGKWVNYPEHGVRACVLNFYEAHGDHRHAVIALAMLYDPEPYVCYYAADAIGKIGTKESLVALRIWLAHPSHPENKELHKYVEQKAKELAQRYGVTFVVPEVGRKVMDHQTEDIPKPVGPPPLKP